MKTRTILIAIAVLVAALAAAPVAAEGGQETFVAQACNLCHAVSSAGIEAKTKSEKLKGPDLTGVGERFEAEWIVKYVKKEVDKEGKAHTKPFKGTDEELQAIVDWLLEQKASE